MAHSKNWFPTRQQELLPFAENIATKITAAPGDYGVLAADASSLSALTASYDSALTAAITPETSTEITVAAKDIAKANLIAGLRRVYKKFEAALLPMDKRLELGLPITDVEPTPVPTPGTKPVLTLLGTDNRAVRVRVADQLTPTRRGKPHGVAGCEIFSFQGETPPGDINAWRFEGQATRSEFIVTFGASAAAGSKVWVAARWYNAKGGAGPVCDAVSSFVGGGIAAVA